MPVGVNDPMGGAFSGPSVSDRARDRATGNLGFGGDSGGGGFGPKGGGQGGGGGGLGKVPGKGLKPIPPVKPKDFDDSDGGALPSEPVDLSLLAGPQELPERRPLQSPSVSVPQTGVTGYAGSFIP